MQGPVNRKQKTSATGAVASAGRGGCGVGGVAAATGFLDWIGAHLLSLDLRRDVITQNSSLAVWLPPFPASVGNAFENELACKWRRDELRYFKSGRRCFRRHRLVDVVPELGATRWRIHPCRKWMSLADS